MRRTPTEHPPPRNANEAHTQLRPHTRCTHPAPRRVLATRHEGGDPDTHRTEHTGGDLRAGTPSDMALRQPRNHPAARRSRCTTPASRKHNRGTRRPHSPLRALLLRTRRRSHHPPKNIRVLRNFRVEVRQKPPGPGSRPLPRPNAQRRQDLHRRQPPLQRGQRHRHR